MNRYFLEIHEDGHRIPVGKDQGYSDLEEAKRVAMRYVDDALPRNTVQVLCEMGHVYLGGDGGSYYVDKRKADKE